MIYWCLSSDFLSKNVLRLGIFFCEYFHDVDNFPISQILKDMSVYYLISLKLEKLKRTKK
jgi:hypothetical protein